MIFSFLKIRPEEAKRTTLAGSYLFFAIGAFIIGRIVRSVLFLEIPNYREKLPLVYVFVAIAVALTMYGYSRVEGRLRRDKTNGISLALLAAVTLGFRILLPQLGHAGYWVFYVFVEIFGTVLVVQFWSMNNELFNSRQAKRLFAVIGGGGVAANIFIGLAISKVVHELGTENLLYVLLGCLLACFILVLWLGKDAKQDLQAAHDRRPKRGHKSASKAVPKVFDSRHVQLIALVIVLTYWVSTFVDYQFQVIVGDFIPGKNDRSAFFGNFFAVTGIIGGFIQFFITARLLERFGVLLALLMLPVSMLLGSVALVLVPLFPALWAAAYTRGCENVLRYTVNDTTLQLLYLPIPSSIRGRAKTIIDGILKPLSIGTAGIVMALLVGQMQNLIGVSLGFVVDVYRLGLVVAVGLVAWVVALLSLRKEYVKSLLKTLERRRLNFSEANFEINDHGTIHVIEKALTSSNVGDVLHGLELLGHVSSKLREPLQDKAETLLFHEADEVRVAALAYLASTGTRLQGETISKLIQDTSPDVQASAARTVCAVAPAKALDLVQPMLTHPQAKVRAHAVAGLICHCGLDGVLASADVLKAMLASKFAEDRRQAAWILGAVSAQGFYQPLLPLLKDPDETVRVAAIEAAGKLRNPELIKPLIAQLDTPRLCNAATQALAAYGPSILGKAEQVLKRPDIPAHIRKEIPRIVARVGDSRGIPILCSHLSDIHAQVRAAVIHALGVLIQRIPGVPVEKADVQKALKMEARTYFTLLCVREDLQLDEKNPLLLDALAHRETQVQKRMLGLLALQYPADTIELVSRNMRSSQAATRANAIEVLDNLLTADEKSLVLTLLDDAPVDKKIQTGVLMFHIQRRNQAERLQGLLRGNDPWFRVCAAMAVAAYGLKHLVPDVLRLADDKVAHCRETALVALCRLGATEQALGKARVMQQDPSPHVRKYATFLAKQGQIA